VCVCVCTQPLNFFIFSVETADLRIFRLADNTTGNANYYFSFCKSNRRNLPGHSLDTATFFFSPHTHNGEQMKNKAIRVEVKTQKSQTGR
jgi:hypothetical protein